jgi:hypothetical protein
MEHAPRLQLVVPWPLLLLLAPPPPSSAAHTPGTVASCGTRCCSSDAMAAWARAATWRAAAAYSIPAGYGTCSSGPQLSRKVYTVYTALQCAVMQVANVDVIVWHDLAQYTVS